DCGADRALLDAVVESLRLGDEVTIEVRREARGHAAGTRVLVGVRDRVERTVPALREVVKQAEAPDSVKTQALDAINRLARAESEIHGLPEEQVHLHELGGADTLVDVVGAFWLLHALDVRKVFASPLPAPRGIKHGMPLPAPASLRVIEGTGAVLQPIDETRELVTPTGAQYTATLIIRSIQPTFRHSVLGVRHEFERGRPDPLVVDVSSYGSKVEAEPGDPEQIPAHGVTGNVPERPRNVNVISGCQTGVRQHGIVGYPLDPICPV